MKSSGPDPQKLPLLRAELLEKEGRANSIDYEDFVIGGNSYNAHITEKLYRPQVIHVSNRSKFRLYFLNSPSKLPVKTHKVDSPSHRKQVGSEERAALPSPALQRRQEALDQTVGIDYPRPALTFPEKLYRIKRLADATISFA